MARRKFQGANMIRRLDRKRSRSLHHLPDMSHPFSGSETINLAGGRETGASGKSARRDPERLIFIPAAEIGDHCPKSVAIKPGGLVPGTTTRSPGKS